jgi:hypothetical protein
MREMLETVIAVITVQKSLLTEYDVQWCLAQQHFGTCKWAKSEVLISHNKSGITLFFSYVSTLLTAQRHC